MTTSTALTLNGTWHPRFARLLEKVQANLDSGTEIGLSLSMDVAGESLADFWGGWRDREHTTPWTQDTIVNVWSTTKTVSSLALLMLVDRGQVDVFAPVATYWPEFAAQGKEKVEVRHILGHTSGVSAWETPFHLDEPYDHIASAAKLAGQAPWWEPGSASAYHASNYGHLIGEIVRRVTGKTLGEFVRDEITGPLGADFHLGLDDAEFGRVATIYAPVALDMSASLPDEVSGEGADLRDVVAAKTLAGSMADIPRANSAPWRRAEIGAANGQTNAKALTTIFNAITLGGSTQGVQLLSPRTIDLIFELQADGVDMFLNIPLRWGIGYALPSVGVPFVRGSKTCFWGGWGGSMIIMDLERQVTFSYVMNQMQAGTIGSDIVAEYVDLAYACLDAIQV
jgi:CubicO group peptidase (beta-lactamase class C family)